MCLLISNHNSFHFLFSADLKLIDQDTISERDYACPAKRRRHDEFNDELVQLRRPLPSSTLIAQRNDIEFKYRIDCVDPPTDSFGKR